MSVLAMCVDPDAAQRVQYLYLEPDAAFFRHGCPLEISDISCVTQMDPLLLMQCRSAQASGAGEERQGSVSKMGAEKSKPWKGVHSQSASDRTVAH